MVDVILKGLQDTLVSFLEEGFSVKLDEFGSFRPAINAESQDKEDDVNVHTIIRRKIIFTPGSKFKAMLGGANIELFGDGTTITESADSGNPSGRNSGGEAPDPAAYFFILVLLNKESSSSFPYLSYFLTTLFAVLYSFLNSRYKLRIAGTCCSSEIYNLPFSINQQIIGHSIYFPLFANFL